MLLRRCVDDRQYLTYEDAADWKRTDTSKHDSCETVYGHQGVFLSLLASLSLLTIISRHHLHRSHNSLSFHHSAVIARHRPAPLHQELPFRSHGTRVAVRDLFGNMPVRVKYLALTTDRQGAVSSDWRELKRMTAALLLAWGRGVKIILRDAERDKKCVLRWPNSEARYDDCLERLRTAPCTSVAITQSMLVQGLKLPPRLQDTWVSVSATSSALRIDGAIAMEPVPSRHLQFIAFGIEPVTSDTEYNDIFHRINALFAASSFGRSSEAVCVEGGPKDRRELSSEGGKRPDQQPDIRSRGIDRWPMFFLRISRLESPSTSEIGAPGIGLDPGLITALTLLVQATIMQFLHESGLEPRRPRPTGQPEASTARDGAVSKSIDLTLPRRESDQDPSGDKMPDSDGDPQNPSCRTSRPSRAATQATRSSAVRRAARRFQFDDLGGGVILPDFGRETSIDVGAEPSMWSRMKSSKRCGHKTIVQEARRKETGRTVHARGLDPTRVSVSSPARAASTEKPSPEDGSRNSQPEIIPPEPQEDAQLVTTLPSSTRHDPQPGDDVSEPPSGSDEERVCVNPKTRLCFRLNTRTGNVVSPPTEKLRIVSASRAGHSNPDGARKRQKQDGAELYNTSSGPELGESTWFRNVLAGWENPVFSPPERPTLQGASGFMSLVEATSSRDGACGGSAFLKVRHPDVDVDGARFCRLSKAGLRSARVIAQFDSKFILVRVKDYRAGRQTVDGQNRRIEALVAIDQHAADERCRIEALFVELCAKVPVDQAPRSSLGHHSLVKTVVLEKSLALRVTASELRLFHASAAYFARWGILYDLTIEPAGRAEPGKETVSVTTIPPGIAERCKSEPRLLTDLLRREVWERHDAGSVSQGSSAAASCVDPVAASGREDAGQDATSDGEEQPWLGQLRDCPRMMLDMLNSRACRSESVHEPAVPGRIANGPRTKGAIMFNDPLSVEECQGLVSRLAECVFPFQCAHGRSVLAPLSCSMYIGRRGRPTHSSSSDQRCFQSSTWIPRATVSSTISIVARGRRPRQQSSR